jgi:hypothetical protein
MQFENVYTYPEGVVCKKCNCVDVEAHVVDEVNGQAVGPYTVYRCQDCDYEWYEE